MHILFVVFQLSLSHFNGRFIKGSLSWVYSIPKGYIKMYNVCWDDTICTYTVFFRDVSRTIWVTIQHIKTVQREKISWQELLTATVALKYIFMHRYVRYMMINIIKHFYSKIYIYILRERKAQMQVNEKWFVITKLYLRTRKFWTGVMMFYCNNFMRPLGACILYLIQPFCKWRFCRGYTNVWQPWIIHFWMHAKLNSFELTITILDVASTHF